MKIISTNAVMEAEPPTFISFLKLNSNPRLKRRKITPISASVLILVISTTEGKILKLGLTRNPAIIYPKTSGCFIFLKIRTTNAATININAKSSINFGKWPILRKCVFSQK